jgi:hypothetical protein
LLATFAFEVDGDRPPVPDEVVEQEPRRPVVARAALDVRVQYALEGVAVMLRAGGRHGLEQEEHAAGEVAVGVLVEPDAAGEILHVHLRREGSLRAGARSVQAHDVGEIAEVRGERRPGEFGIQGELSTRHSLRLRLRRAFGRGVEQEPIEVAELGDFRATPAAEQHDARLLRQADLT